MRPGLGGRTILPPERGNETYRYLAQLGMGWEVTSGFHISTVGPVPDDGDVDIVVVAYPDGQPTPLPTEALSSDHLEQWRGYTLDIHGQPALDLEHPRGPVWRFPESYGALSRPIEVVRIRVQAAGSDLYAELIIPAIEGRPIRTGIFGWDQQVPTRMPPSDEIAKAVHGLELLGLMPGVEAARRRWAVLAAVTVDMMIARFLELEGRYHRRPNQDELAGSYSVARSALTRWLDDQSLIWSEFLARVPSRR